MVDRFPEAFRRYEDDVDTSDLDTFPQLLTSFKMWGKERFPATNKQKRALGKEGEERLGIAPLEEQRITYGEKKISYVNKWGTQVEYIRKARVDIITRNVVTGKFAKTE